MWTVNFQMFKLVLEKSEKPKIKLPTSAGLLKNQESSIKSSISALLTMPKPLTVWITTNCGKFWKKWEYQTTWPASWEIRIQVRKQQLELDTEQQTGSKYEKEYIKVVYCHPAYFDAFELWCWRRLLRVPWTARRSNQSILKEISPGCSLEGLMLKLKLQYLATWCEQLTHLKRPWCWERLRAGGEGDNRGWDDWMASPIQWTWVWVDSENWWWTGRPNMLRFIGLQRVRHDWATELNWTCAESIQIANRWEINRQSCTDARVGS